ncbi:ligase-associated DNA damage response endonuclease PdeM [Roseinatronobacter sp. NSM]|uniref:ligase-associated DNA damage response endonuclease PdeM n=1 Tax=Roseinatronobacter sp. NSM TaxID=3457785 RepID=UPI0040374665
MGYEVSFAGAQFTALPTGALWWPAQNALIVADLHLGKSARMARRGGGLLPPFDAQDTLHRLAQNVGATGAAHTFLLGDTFDDNDAADDVTAGPQWQQLQDMTQLICISGNHDPAHGAQDMTLAGITLRHQAAPHSAPDISGHFHPKFKLAGRGHAAFLVGRCHLILPAFGTYTGGLDVNSPVLTGLVGPGLAILTGRVARAVPYARLTPAVRGNA